MKIIPAIIYILVGGDASILPSRTSGVRRRLEGSSKGVDLSVLKNIARKNIKIIFINFFSS